AAPRAPEPLAPLFSPAARGPEVACGAMPDTSNSSSDQPRSLFDLRGRVAIVTGASRGIGEATAARLREAGAQVVMCSRKLDGVTAAKERVAARGPGP